MKTIANTLFATALLLGLPLCWGAAFFAAVIPRARRCGICKSPMP